MRARWAIATLLFASCVNAKESPRVGDESHFLSRCEDACGAGLDCIQGVCTRGCVVDAQSCGDLSADAVCSAEGAEPGEVAVCDVRCARDEGCAGLSVHHRCGDGFCRAPAVSGGSSGPDAGTSFPTDEVFACPEDLGSDPVASDPVEVLRSLIVGNELSLRVSYGGGCEEHTFSVCYGPEFRESYPVETRLRLIHEDRDDPCNAVATEELAFDLTPLAEQYERGYRSDSGLIATSYGMYAFGALSCEERKLASDAQLTAFEEKASRACTTAADCRWVLTNTRCTSGCGVVVSNAGAEELASWLTVMEEEVCGNYNEDGCPPLPLYDCGRPTIMCVDGECQGGF